MTIGIKSLPPLHSLDKYLCFFGSANVSSVGIVAPNEIRCQTPLPALRSFLTSFGRPGVQSVLYSFHRVFMILEYLHLHFLCAEMLIIEKQVMHKQKTTTA